MSYIATADREMDRILLRAKVTFKNVSLNLSSRINQRLKLYHDMPSRHWQKLEVQLYPYVVSATPRPLYPRDRDTVPILEEAGWASGPVWMGP
jgi:hypothetical protein